MQRVVITGLGIWSCLGTSLEEVRNSLYTGKSGIVLTRSARKWGSGPDSPAGWNCRT